MLDAREVKLLWQKVALRPNTRNRESTDGKKELYLLAAVSVEARAPVSW